MFLEYAENTYQLSLTMVVLLLSLFRYIGSKKRRWIYLVVIFLGSLVSSYYWTAYLLIMGESPNVSNVFSYNGWNIALGVMVPFVISFKTKEERWYFHPLMLLPIPLNYYQLTLYLPFGGVLNSIYQVTATTVIACLCLQSICWYRKNRGNGAALPWVDVSILLFVCFEYGMWTCTCFDEPVASLYYLFSFLWSTDFLFITWAVTRTYGDVPVRSKARIKLERILKIVYFAVVIVCAVGGILLSAWIRDTIKANIQTPSSIYDIIPAILFVFSLVITAFAVAIIFVVNLSHKAAENDQLREEKTIAERSNAAKSEFLANMSHEIRTPINAILGMNEIILRESHQARERLSGDHTGMNAVFGDIHTCAGNIESAGNSLLAIINDILDFSKIEAGRLEIVEAEYNLSSVLNDVSNMIIFKARDKGLAFHVDVDETLPERLYGDELRLRQIITNLLNNAVKYTDAGSVTLSLRGEAEADDRIRLIASVRDTGIGIREEDMSRLFGKFERFNLDRNHLVEGTGLGLAITRRLLDLMGGSVDVQSRYGEGSTFIVSLPQKVISREPVGNFRRKFEKSLLESESYQETFHAPDARILIVDDTQMNLTVAKGLLKNTGIGIDTAGSGAEAVEKSRKARYDIILMDQRMPKMDGTEAMHRIKAQADGLNRDTPVICLTADAVSGAKERYIAEGFVDYLTKPIDSRALERMLTRHLPADKIIVMRKEGRKAAPVASEGPEQAYAPLRQAGVSPEIGLRYCQQDEQLYRTVLREFAQSFSEREKAIRQFYDRKDWKNYAIVLHALKSTSGMIGAAPLSEVAARLEAAALEGREGDIPEAHAIMLARHAAVAGAISNVMPEAAATADSAGDILEFGPDPDEDGVLEFLPENDEPR